MTPIQLKKMLDLAFLQGIATLSDGQLVINSELYVPPFDGQEPPEYGPGGYSIETSKGCRRNKLVDEHIAKLRRQDDELINRVLDARAPAWICFDPMALENFRNPRQWFKEGNPDFVHPIESDDPDERALARDAAFLGRFMGTYGNPADFGMYADIDDDGDLDFVKPRNHRVFYAIGVQKGLSADELVAAWPEVAIAMIDKAVQDERDGTTITPEVED